MKTMVAGAIVALAIAAAPVDLTGSWTMTVEGTPHGNATMGLVLKQAGAKVTGTFASGHSPEMAISGEFVDGSLTIETAGDGESKIIFRAKLKDDGTLAGYVSSQMGDMKWTASRQADKTKDGK